MTMIRTGLAAVVMMAGLAAPAIACPPPPPPPAAPAAPAGTSAADAKAMEDAWYQAHWSLDAEREHDRVLKQQTELFDKAGGIVIARLDRTGRTSGYPDQFSYMNNMPLVVMKPVKWAKGAGGTEEFQLVDDSRMMSCGFGRVDAPLRGQPGDVFLFYLEGAAATQDKVLFALPVRKVIEPRALALLTAE